MVSLSFPISLLLTMSKRKSSSTSSSKHLNLYKKSYKGGGTKDLHLAVFRAARSVTDATRVLYPGCHRHLTAALVFPDIQFVDYDSKVAPLYSDPTARDYVETNKEYEEELKYHFFCHDVNNEMKDVARDFDLLISLSAGAISGPCSRYVRKGGYLLVNDSHSDARMAFVSGDWKLQAYWDDDTKTFSTDDLDKCFQVKQKKSRETLSISKKQVEESVEIGVVSKRSFKMLIDPLFFLFRRK